MNWVIRLENASPLISLYPSHHFTSHKYSVKLQGERVLLVRSIVKHTRLCTRDSNILKIEGFFGAKLNCLSDLARKRFCHKQLLKSVTLHKRITRILLLFHVNVQKYISDNHFSKPTVFWIRSIHCLKSVCKILNNYWMRFLWYPE